MKLAVVETPKLILVIALLLGLIVRLTPTLMTGFPLNDGGMFLDMIRDVEVSEYQLPRFTSYNLSDIPFVYPPLGFYLGRTLANVGISEFSTLRFLPVLASVLAIYGVFLFASELTRSHTVGSLAVLLYACAPRSYTWLIMGGGLTRSLGFCFMVFMGWGVIRAFQERDRKWIWISGVFATLTVLSHPEAVIHALTLGVLLWGFYGSTPCSAAKALSIALVTILLSAVWWGPVLSMHGWSPFFSVINTRAPEFNFFENLLRLMFPIDSIAPILSLLFVLALLWGLWQKKYFLALWTLLPLLVQPRSALNVIVIPLSILLAELLIWIGQWNQKWRLIKRLDIFAMIFIAYLFMEAYLFGFRLVNVSLQPMDRVAMQWIREHTPADGRFLILTGVTAPELDSFQEWFPTLTGRHSLTTFQGTEWTLGPDFFPNLKRLRTLQACHDTNCLQAWITENQESVDYIVVRKRTVAPELLDSLKSSQADYEVVREDEAVVIFAPK